MVYNKLYKVDSKGKIRTYQIIRDLNVYRIVTGLHEGKTTSKQVTVKAGKNLGKANETTTEEQANKDCVARYTKKLTENYCESVEAAVALHAEGGAFFQPMLAVDKSKLSDKQLGAPQDWVFDPKLDGMRLTISKDHILSRRGKEVPAAGFLRPILADFFAEFPEMILDGELYNHDYKDQFDELMSLCRKQNPTPAQMEVISSKLQFHVYDIYNTDFPDLDALTRKWNLLLVATNVESDSVRTVPYELVSNPNMTWEQTVNYLNTAYVWNLGYEGIIGRKITSPYQNKRTKDLIKIKNFITEEYEIADVIPEETADGTLVAGSLILAGVPSKAGIRGTEAFAKDLYARRGELVGKLATVRHFGRTKDGSLRFPVCIDIQRWEFE